jgi:hypothetical protein
MTGFYYWASRPDGGRCRPARCATHRTDGQQGNDFYLALLTAGVYLCVRGFDNIHPGSTKAPLDPVLVFLKARIVPRSATTKPGPRAPDEAG